VTDNFFTSFATAFGMIIFSELGDKTFLIAAILAMRHSRLTVFLATTSALALMTVISVVAGMILPTIMPRSFTKWIAAVALLVFGVLMLKEGCWEMGEETLREEYDEVIHRLEGERAFSMSLENLESQPASPSDDSSRSASEKLGELLTSCFGEAVPPVAVQTFSMVFLAEWGDRSQLATIVLGAAQNAWGVALGASLGHAVCSAIAVVLGRALSRILSIRTVTILGGLLFIAFSVLTVL
jgi:putative Ca2+/H+ antiporter (TMEM165/GDT1 family)